MTEQPLDMTRRLLERTEAELKDRRRRLSTRAYGSLGLHGEIDAITTLVKARERFRRRISKQEMMVCLSR